MCGKVPDNGGMWCQKVTFPSSTAENIFHYEIFQMYMKAERTIKGKPMYSPHRVSDPA